MASRPCEHCFGDLPLLARRTARFCSTRCRTAAHRAAKAADPVPAELRKQPRWVRWQTVRRRSAKPTKMPTSLSGAPASSTDPETWTTHAKATASDVGDGYGFVLNGDGIVCLDIDGCIAPSGTVTPPALELIRLAGATYVEVSPSGYGLHIWGRANLQTGRVVKFRGQTVEIYPNGRYLTVTGKPFRSAPSHLADITDAIQTALD